MTSRTQNLTLKEFRTHYAGAKPHFEYCFGNAIQKSMPTWLHGLVQRLISNLLSEAGYISATEVELRITQDWQPVPDVSASTQLEQPYPTKPVPIVVEVLSPDDRIAAVRAKCQDYANIGIQQVFVIDPEKREIMEWDDRSGNLASVPALSLENGRRILASKLWKRLDKELQRQPADAEGRFGPKS